MGGGVAWAQLARVIVLGRSDGCARGDKRTDKYLDGRHDVLTLWRAQRTPVWVCWRLRLGRGLGEAVRWAGRAIAGP